MKDRETTTATAQAPAAVPAGRAARTLALLAVTVLLLAPALALLYRVGVLGLGTALSGVAAAAGLAALLVLAAMVVAFLGWRRNSTADIALAGLAACLALVPVAMVGGQMYVGSKVPAIHDITTNFDDPPVLVGVAEGIPEKSLEHGGAEVWAAQIKAYPEVKSLVLNTDPLRTFDLLLAEVEKLGWDVALADREDGHLEAVHTSLWFGFKDDIVVRVQAYPKGSLVDARSVSRVGQSDLGANARRIVDLFQRLGTASRP